MFRKEFAYYFSTPIAYMVTGLYLAAVSAFLWIIPGEWNIVDSGYADASGMFSLSPWLLMLLCPALTMRLFAEERQNGMWDVLMSKRLSITRIVLGKYFAAMCLTLIAIVPCTVHYVILYFIAEPVGNVDGGAFAGSMFGLGMLSLVFIAVGLAAATLSRNQIVNYLLGAVLCFSLYWLVFQSHYESLSRGVLDMRDIVFFLSFAASVLLITIICYDSYRTSV